MFLLGEEQNYLKICLTHDNQSLHTDNLSCIIVICIVLMQ